MWGSWFAAWWRRKYRSWEDHPNRDPRLAQRTGDLERWARREERMREWEKERERELLGDDADW
jgi:hypothetical protein